MGTRRRYNVFNLVAKCVSRAVVVAVGAVRRMGLSRAMKVREDSAEVKRSTFDLDPRRAGEMTKDQDQEFGQYLTAALVECQKGLRLFDHENPAFHAVRALRFLHRMDVLRACANSQMPDCDLANAISALENGLSYPKERFSIHDACSFALEHLQGIVNDRAA